MLNAFWIPERVRHPHAPPHRSRTIPVVVRGKDYVFAQSLDDVAKFVGVGHSAERLPPSELVDRWMTILDIATDTDRSYT